MRPLTLPIVVTVVLDLACAARPGPEGTVAADSGGDRIETADAAAAGPPPPSPSGKTFLPLKVNALPLRFGADQSGAKLLAGDLDRVRIYHRVLGDAEIAAEVARKYPTCDDAGKCVAEWTFDELRDGTFASTAGTRLAGKVTGTVRLVDSPEGRAAHLEGGWIEVQDDPALSFTDELTYTAWVRRVPCPTDFPGMCVEGHLVDKGGWFALEARTDHRSNLVMMVQQTGPFYCGLEGTPPTDAWTHVAVSFGTRTGLRCYRNGKLRWVHLPEGRVIPPLTVTTQPLRFGNDSGAWPFAGDLDRIRLYRRALSADEIAAHAGRRYEACAKAQGCVGEWTFDDVQGAIAPNSADPNMPARLVGTTALVDGPDGKALHVENGWAEVANGPELAITDSFTWSGWVRWSLPCPATFKSKCLLEAIFWKGSWFQMIQDFNNQIRLQPPPHLYYGGYRTTSWIHLAIAYDTKTGIRYYQNGKLYHAWLPGELDNNF
jgi:hypothetical protein